MSVFRAVENGVFVVRCANTGISCFIDPCGRILDRVKNKDGKDIFVSGVLTRTVITRPAGTIYTRFGDWFAWLCLGCTALFLISGLVKKK
jgi:apolipoprotein N-acyltransferase